MLRITALALLLAAPLAASAQDGVNLKVDITRADGTTRSGKVLKIERSEDWYAEKGFTDKAVKTTVTLEGKGTEVEKTWADIKSVEIAYTDAVDCQFDSSYSPIMYMCVLKTDTKVTTKEGETWEGASRHKWKFHFDSGDPEEFYLYKVPARQQEENVATLGDGSTQNTELYQVLQKQLKDWVKGPAITKITITPG